MAKILIDPDKPNGDGDGGGGGGGQGPCSGEGYKAKAAYNPPHGYIQLQECKSGYSPKKASDGYPWCCKDEGDPPGPDDERPPNCPNGVRRDKAEDPCPEGLPRKLYNKGQYWCCPEGDESKPEPDGDCPQGDWYTEIDGKPVTGPGDCVQGYAYIQKGAKKRCECIKWCVDEYGCDETCRNCSEGGGDGEQWKPSEDLQAIIQSLLARINELLGYDTGLSEEELQMIINRMTGNIKAGERGRIESMEDRMAGMGLLGTGMELEEYGKIGRETREVTADVEAQVAIDQALRKYEEFMGTTGMAQSLFGTTLGAEQLEEILNAARRGEGRQDMGMMLQYLSMILGKDAQNPYWQAILNNMNNRQPTDGGGNDWMYWLPFLLS